MNKSGGGAFLILVPILIACGALSVIAATRADVFKPQPNAAVVSAAYATRAKIENDNMRESLAADLAHHQTMQRIETDFVQTGKDLLIVAGGAGVLGVLMFIGTSGYRMAGQSRLNAHVINPNKRGQFPVMVDRQNRLMHNLNMQTTATLQMDGAQPLPPELQIEAYAWQQRANIAASMATQKTFATTATQERGLLRQVAMPALTDRIAPIVIGETPQELPDDGTGIHMHDDPAIAQKHGVVNTARGGVPSDITNEQEFNDYINANN